MSWGNWQIFPECLNNGETPTWLPSALRLQSILHFQLLHLMWRIFSGEGFFRIYALFCFFIFCKRDMPEYARSPWCTRVCAYVHGRLCVWVCVCLCVWVSERFCLRFPPQVTEVLQVVLMSSSQICSLISKNSWKVFRCLQTFPPRAKRNTERG